MEIGKGTLRVEIGDWRTERSDKTWSFRSPFPFPLSFPIPD